MRTGRLSARAVVRASLAAVCAAGFAAAVSTPAPYAQAKSAAIGLESPAADGSQAYAVTTAADGNTYLIWIEAADNADNADDADNADNAEKSTYSLKFSRLDGQRWTPAREIGRGSNWFVNWADHPSLTAMPDGSLLAHWLVNTGRKQGSYGYGVHVARSIDRGATWSTIFEDGMQNVSDYAGFLTFAAGGHGVDAIYLTPLKPDEGGDDHGEHEGIKTLAAVSFNPDGSVKAQKVVDADVCSCCMTDIGFTTNGPVAVYRDHLAGDIRDISIVRRVNGAWTEPAPVHRDGWTIAGCPTNGPALAARGARVAVAWFTAVNDRPRLQLAFSDDSGASFAAPIAIDDGQPVGWPDLLMLEDGAAEASAKSSSGASRPAALLAHRSPWHRRSAAAQPGSPTWPASASAFSSPGARTACSRPWCRSRPSSPDRCRAVARFRPTGTNCRMRRCWTCASRTCRSRFRGR